MTSPQIVIAFILICMWSSPTWAQHADSTLDNLQQIPTKYVKDIDKKITQYSSRITKKTEKTLTKLSRWENKIQGLLQRVSPEAANRLFGNNQLTFTSLLQQIKSGEAHTLQYQATYNKYRDDVTTSFEYLAQQKQQLDSGLIKKIQTVGGKMEELAIEEDKSEALQQFIKERKKQLIEQGFQYIGKNKYLIKINKEAYYYSETLKNYKELFSDSKKAEAIARTILNKIPAFQKFLQNNSQMAALFGPGVDAGMGGNTAGLQTRASIQTLIQDRLTSGGSGAIQQNIQEAQGQLNKLKDKLLAGVPGSNDSNTDMPDFKPNEQKAKTFKQRLEYGFNIQFAKSNTLLPTTTDISLAIGYKLNSKSVFGVGTSYKLGMGNFRHISFTHQGIGLRSYMDWKLKKQFFISGGYEVNHNAQFKNIVSLKNYNAWQRSALLGITKKINVKTKWFNSSNVQLLYDFLSYEHIPASQPFLFRVGYTIK
ncbi:MAG: hypothetical protein ABIN67_10875 [Ferruginibacter sp.]